MAIKIIIEFTERQFIALIDSIDSLEAMVGSSDAEEYEEDFDKTLLKDIKQIDKALLKSGYKR